VSVLYNTYWVRFNHKLFKHAGAVRNTERLFAAGRENVTIDAIGPETFTYRELVKVIG
jgi:hypothetical protein